MQVREWQRPPLRCGPDCPRWARGASAVLLTPILLVMAVSIIGAGGADTVAAVDPRKVVDAYYAIMNAPGFDPKTPIGPDPREVQKVERELQRLKEGYARQRAAGLGPEAKAAYEKQLLEKSAELQTLYSKNWKDVVDVVKWRSPEVLGLALFRRIAEYGQEKGLAVILNKETGGEMYRREGWAGSTSDPIDITQDLIEWLGQKEQAARPSGRAVPNGGR